MAEIDLVNLPYGYLRRFVDIMPIEVLDILRKMGPDGAWLTKRRPVKKCFVLKAASNALIKDPTNYIVATHLNLTVKSVDEGEYVLPLVHGTYKILNIRGSYSWSQAVNLIHSNVTYACLERGLQLPEKEFDGYVAAVCEILMKQTICIHVDVMPWELYEKFEAAIKALPVGERRISFVPFFDDKFQLESHEQC